MTLRIAFTDFWPGFDPDSEWLVRVLRTRFDIEATTDPAAADLVIASVFGTDHLRYACTRVFVCWENQAWPRARFDWSFGGDYSNHPRHYRLPLWVVHLDIHPEYVPADPTQVLREKSEFAAMVVSSPSGVVRNRLHERIDGYRRVASGGGYRNNVGGRVADKLAFIRHAKFAFACEGSSHAGYSTEKLIHALAAETVPIYWGDPRVAEDFNPRRFLNYHDFATEDAFVQRLIEVDQDDDAYCRMLAEPWFRNGVLPKAADKSALLDHFERIVSWTGTPVSEKSWLRLTPTKIADRLRARQRFNERRATA